ncbi:heterokaryon incompatibility protein-domain-containing protein, partial [Nemania sp. FL0916]
MGERTGPRVLSIIWSYVLDTSLKQVYILCHGNGFVVSNSVSLSEYKFEKLCLTLSIMESVAGQLYHNCSLLIIDDKALGGHTEFIGPRKRKFLRFDQNYSWQHFHSEYKFEDLYPSLPSLATSALAGCICCAQIRDAILAAEPPEGAVGVILMASYLWSFQARDEYFPKWPPDRGLAAMLLQVNFMSGMAGQQPLSRPLILFSIDSSSAPCIMWLRLETSPEHDALSPGNIAWIKEFLLDFEKEDVALGIERDDRFLPTRLIDLGDDSNGRLARLVLATDLRNTDGRLNYAALSYCWGPPAAAANQYQTTRETLEQRQARIDIAQTTPVIKDAADVCRAVGVRYLWVDAVCIIQNDKRDWEQEASRMCNVYRNATLTICSLSSSSCTQGFLSKRSHGINIPFRSRISPDIVGHYTLRNSMLYAKDSGLTGYSWDDDNIEAVWGTRAWTFQENQLSRVSLLFGKRKLHIVSRRGIISEGETGYLNTWKPSVSVLEELIASGEDLEPETVHNYWMTLTKDYSWLTLAYPTDKFPALSGLAAYFHSLLGSDDQYLAGLWKKDLHRQLFWRPINDERRIFEELFRPRHSIQQFIAPSWSWASQDCASEYSHRYFHTNGSYADYRPEYLSVEPYITQGGIGLNPYGQIENASLRINSRIRRMPLPLICIHDDNFTCPLWQIKTPKGGYLADCSTDWNEESDIRHLELDLLLLGSCIEKNETGPFGQDQRYAWGLIICPAPRDRNALASGYYYRAGIFYSKPKDQAGLNIFEGCDNRTVCL